jgi:hypothetical protein
MEESEGNECIICLTDPKEVRLQQSRALALQSALCHRHLALPARSPCCLAAISALVAAASAKLSAVQSVAPLSAVTYARSSPCPPVTPTARLRDALCEMLHAESSRLLLGFACKRMQSRISFNMSGSVAVITEHAMAARCPHHHRLHAASSHSNQRPRRISSCVRLVDQGDRVALAQAAACAGDGGRVSLVRIVKLGHLRRRCTSHLLPSPQPISLSSQIKPNYVHQAKTYDVSHSTAESQVPARRLHSCCTVLSSSVAAYANCATRRQAPCSAPSHRRQSGTDYLSLTLLPPPCAQPAALVRSVPASPTASV